MSDDEEWPHCPKTLTVGVEARLARCVKGPGHDGLCRWRVVE